MNILQDDDWIVHLDEETLLTVNSVSSHISLSALTVEVVTKAKCKGSDV